jgi:putative heme-binding domain-containing protein
MTEAIRAAPGDDWMRRAVMSANSELVGTVLWNLLAKGFLRESADPARTRTVRELAALTAANGDLEMMAACASEIHEDIDWIALAVVSGFGEGLPRGPLRTHGSLGDLSAHPEDGKGLAPVQRVLAGAGAIARDPGRPLADRLAALPLVAEQGFDRVAPLLAELLDPAQPPDLQIAACRLLPRYGHEKAAEFLFPRWNSLGPASLREALAILTGNNTTARQLMEKMKAGEINRALMPPMQRWTYYRSGDPVLKALAVELFGKPDPDRAAVIADYKQALSTSRGDPVRGRAVFEKAACITCHRIGEIGVEVGPNLSDVRLKLPESLLADILDPNRMVEERWVACTVKTVDGRTIAGLVTSENSASVSLTLPGGLSETVARDQIVEVTNTGQSLMPVGLESALSKQDMADLLAFLKER